MLYLQIQDGNHKPEVISKTEQLAYCERLPQNTIDCIIMTKMQMTLKMLSFQLKDGHRKPEVTPLTEK